MSPASASGDPHLLSWKKKLLLVVVMAAAVVVTLEIAARLLVPEGLIESVVPALITRFDERFGWAPRAGAHGTSSRTGSSVEYRINSKGLRDEETAYKKPERTFRIALIGDSRTFGYGVPIEKHFSKILEEQFAHVEVINLGVSGFGVDQELLYLRSEGLRYDPDLVIALVPDFSDNRHMHTRRWGMEKPRFKLIDGDLVLTNSPVVQHTAEAAPTTLARLDRWCTNRSKLYEVLSGALLRLAGHPRGPGAQQSRQDVRDEQDPAFMKELYELGLALIQAMHDESAAHGVDFVLVTEMKDVHDAAVARRIFSLDVQAPMAGPDFALPYGLTHTNEAGNRVLAAEIAAFLQSSGLIPARHLRANASKH